MRSVLSGYMYVWVGQSVHESRSWDECTLTKPYLDSVIFMSFRTLSFFRVPGLCHFGEFPDSVIFTSSRTLPFCEFPDTAIFASFRTRLSFSRIFRLWHFHEFPGLCHFLEFPDFDFDGRGIKSAYAKNVKIFSTTMLFQRLLHWIWSKNCKCSVANRILHAGD